MHHFDVKICGLTTAETVEAALDAGATMIGFVFAEGSPRQISPKDAAALALQAKGRAKSVGLFADQTAGEIARIRQDVPLDLVQIHGRENDETRRALVRAFPGCLLAKGIAVHEDLPTADDPTPGTWLFDARPTKGVERQGGHGQAFDWLLLADYQEPSPFLLAGGLTPENVGEAIRVLSPLPHFAGVDVSSGVEVERGVKDPMRIHAFVKAALAARAANPLS